MACGLAPVGRIGRRPLDQHGDAADGVDRRRALPHKSGSSSALPAFLHLDEESD